MQPSEPVGSSQHTLAHRKFSALLGDRGLVGRDDLAAAEALADREHLELADAVVSLHLLSEADSYAALAAAAGVPVVPGEIVPSELAVRLVPEWLARRHFVVPIAVDNRVLRYATCLPFSAEGDGDLGFACGRRTKAMVATRSAVVEALDRCYPKRGDLDARAARPGGTSERAAPRPATTGVAQPRARGRSRVLIADDDAITRMLVKRLLEQENFEVIEARNGDEAVALVTREHPDLVLIDLNMPVMDGYEAIHHLRQDGSLARLPIIVLTAEEGGSVERRVLAMGAEDYMIKPFDGAILLARVNAVFSRLKMTGG